MKPRKRAEGTFECDENIPSGNGGDGVEQKGGKLVELDAFPDQGFIHNVERPVVEAIEVGIEKSICLYAGCGGVPIVVISILSVFNKADARYIYIYIRRGATHPVVDVCGEKSGSSVTLGVVVVVFSSVARRLATGSAASRSAGCLFVGGSATESSCVVDPGEDDGCSLSAFFSFSLASNPSTLFKRASKTSVFGPRFFGTASIKDQ